MEFPRWHVYCKWKLDSLALNIQKTTINRYRLQVKR
jgi:hypothetical protein